MTRAEMTQLFTVMTLAWPNAEMLKGGVQKLAPTITLWATCAAEVDFWTGQQAVIQLCRTNKFPPTIAEFLEQAASVTRQIHVQTEQQFLLLRSFSILDGSLEAVYQGLPPGSLMRQAIDRMGGTAALTETIEECGPPRKIWNRSGFERACEAVIRGEPALIGGGVLELPEADRR